MIQINERAWRRSVDAEREDSTHECDKFMAHECWCEGACGCHWTDDPEEAEPDEEW